ncbi:sodium/calcium exchanger NCL2-like [Rhodamnia argentea]|uniref:Sodium/calcium exchanger NCL2-like n=1 Tax=Rhodamnia argentea TaxID=178133 RepID=A0A8B8QZ60_9MYRT|nr:sodium/calcium exchanger NCL2-like [Rhodamnia argentea]
MRLAFFMLLVIITRSANSRSIRGSFDAVSDGMDGTNGTSSALGLTTTTVTCEPTYGFLPCTTELWGELFLIVVYEYLLALASSWVSSGSELFFRMFGTGLFGASLFQMLGTFPQVIIMLASAVTSSSDTIESMATMGMAMLAGSAIFSLSLVWGSVIAFGSRDFSSSSSSSTSVNQSTKTSISLTGSGVETDTETKYIARIMFVSMIPFLILQLAKIINSTTGTRIVVLISLIITVIYLIIYCTYQVFQPWIQRKRLAYITRLSGGESIIESLLTIDGKPSELRIKDLFQKIDQNQDSKVSKTELYAFMLGIQIEEAGMSTDDFSDAVMKKFDISQDEGISESEFVQGLCKWLDEDMESTTNGVAQGRSSSTTSSKTTSNKSQGTSDEQATLLSQDKTSKPTNELTVWWNYTKAGFLIILGTGVMMLIGQPLMESIEEFASAADIPSFFVSYVLIPLANSYRQILGAISSAKKKTKKDISGAFTEVYQGVFMNNVMGLATFLALVYIKDITWDVSAEVLVVLLICTLMGTITSFRTKFQFWTCILAFALYPVSLLLLYILTSVLGWS